MKFFITIFFSFIYMYLPAKNVAFTKDSSSTTVIVFEDANNEPIEKNKKGKIKRNFAKNNVKVGLLGGAFGQVPFYYERYIADWFTIQAGVGITFRDFIGDYYKQLTFGSKAKYKTATTTWTGINESSIYDNSNNYAYRKSSVGVSFSLAPRFFLGGDAFDGFFLSPIVEYSIRNYKAQKVDVNGVYQKNDTQKESTNQIKFLLCFGSQRNFEPVILNWSLGLGIVSNSFKRLDIGYTNDSFSNQIYGNRTVSYKRLSPYFNLNLDLGLAFLNKKKTK